MPAISAVAERGREDPLGLVVDALGGAGRRGFGDGLVVGGLGGPAFLAATLLHGAVDAGGGPAHRDGVRVVDVDGVQFVEHAQADGKPLRVDTGAELHDAGSELLAVLCHRHCRSSVTRAAAGVGGE
ncbi:hypothetical protein OKW18_000571 [Streptomyces pratensis]|nr:hypothetical protein [Streptomyces pratensis]